ncbi:LPXTG-motif cell wall-anchored protein [Neobacillus niacini]|uniref:lamin tail domain-containing protein n=1 Tax=Neobacillus niacini TaxID=86668 RepID=UPI0028637E34|nr:lamin tail domain-containing protein [Neobacillus niacini]MDR7080551.1 LPXTG-motif cell wall-anchored protein [Neobacillus niacini]
MKQTRGKKAKKLVANVCIMSILLSNISLTFPTSTMLAVANEQNITTEITGSDVPVTQPESEVIIPESTTDQEQLTNDNEIVEPDKTNEAVEDESQTLNQVSQPTTPGEELNQAEIVDEDYNSLPPLLITEISPDTSGADNYEYFELYNNTNQPMALTNYSFIYRYTDGTLSDKEFQIAPVTLEPQETKVFWFNKSGLTLADYNNHFGSQLTSDQVVEYKDVFPGFSNGGNRAVGLTDQQGNEVIFAGYLPNETDNAGLVVQYKYPSTGIEMDKFAVLAVPTPGIIEAAQVPAAPVVLEATPADTTAPEIVHSPITESQASTPIKIEATITDDKAVPYATLYFKEEGAESFTSVLMRANAETPSTYSAEIPGISVTRNLIYYIEATDGVNSKKTEEYTISPQVPAETFSDLPLLITELSPNSKGGGTDFYEYFELYNNTNQPMTLTNYSFVYRYTDGTQPDKVFQIEPVTLEPQETKVFWFNNGNLTLADFNNNYGLGLTGDKIVEFKDVFPGFANGGNRALIIKDHAGLEIVSASYLGEENDNNGAVIEYRFPSTGTEMEKYKVKTSPTPGNIERLQVPTNPIDLNETPKDEEAPVITHTPVTEIDAFTAITIVAAITDNIAVPFATLYYKKAGEENFTSLAMSANAADAGSYTADIPSSYVESDITYYIEATDGVNSEKTEEYSINVNQPDVDFNKIPQFLVTEVVPDSTNVGSADGYEFIEIYNNSDKDMNFKDYKIQYRYGEDPATDVIWPSIPDDVVIPSKGTLVFWIINGQNNQSTVADFNANYGTSLIEDKDIVRINSAGMANGSMRGLVLATNAKKEIAVSYYFDEANVDDTNANKGILYKYPVDGSTKMIKVNPGLNNATPGKVEAFQVPVKPVHIEEDTIAPTIENMTAATEINQKENIQISADAADNNEVKSVRLFYRTNTETNYNEAILAENFDDMMYHHTIYSPDIIGKEYVEYYFVVSDGTNVVTSNTYKIIVTSDLDNSSLRLNVKDGDIVNGEKILKGTSETDSPDQVKLFIDGTELKENTYKSIEHTAYFAFEVNGVNTFFQNGVTMGDEILKIFDDGINDWDTITIPIDADRLQVGENTITIRAGNKASPFQLEESEENRDDYNVRNARLVLPNGTVLIDPTHNDPAKVYDMGDDGVYRPFEDFKFTIGQEYAPSMTYKWDTTAVSDGEHVVKTQDTDEEVSKTILVDNTVPVIASNLIEGKEYKGIFTINVDVTDEIAGVDVKKIMLDDKEIEAPIETSSSKLLPGNHKLTVNASDKVGNLAELTINFSVVNENPNKPELVSPNDGSDTPVDGDPTLKVKVTDPTNDEIKVTFFKGFKYDASNINDVKAYQNTTDMEPPRTMIPEGEKAFAAEDISLVSARDQNYLTIDSSDQFPYHRFDVSVDPSIDESDIVELVWNGKSLEGRKVSMYAWNHLQAKWLLVTYKIAGTEDFELKANVEVNEYVNDGKINVLIQDEIPQTPDEYDYTFVWMSDTQYYSESYPYIFERQTNWIAENKDKLKIKYVFHTGDVVDEADQEYQWNYADEYMKVLEYNHVPYGVLAGNHDVNHKTNDYTQFSKWFGEDRFKDKQHYGGSYKNNRGHYDLISSNGNDFIMLYMGWGIQDEDLKWMDDVLKQYPNRKAILNFHEYLLVSGNRSPLGNKIYNEVVLANENVIAVLSGHYHDSETLIDPIDDNGDGTTDREVYQMLGDYQGGPEGGQGYMKLLHFDQDNNRIIVNTYSPYLDDYNFYDPQNFPGKDEMIINLDLSVDEKRVATDYFAVNVYTDTKIGEQDQVASGNTAATEWLGLTENNMYSWYAVAEDTYTGKAVSEIWSFTKGKVEQPNIPDPSNDNENPVPGDSETPPTNGGVQPSNPQDTSNGNNNNNSNNSQPKDSGKWLPNTATNSYNLLLIGFLILIAGGSILIVRIRYMSTRNR